MFMVIVIWCAPARRSLIMKTRGVRRDWCQAFDLEQLEATIQLAAARGGIATASPPHRFSQAVVREKVRKCCRWWPGNGKSQPPLTS